MEFRFSTGFFSVPNELIEKWHLTGLEPIDFLIFCSYLKLAFGKQSKVFPSQGFIAAQLGISTRHLRDRHAIMERKGLLSTIRTPGRISTVDLNPVKEYIRTLNPPVDELPGLSTTPELQFRSTPEPQFRGVGAENGTKGEEIREGRGRDPGGNKQRVKKTPCSNNRRSVDSRTPDPPSRPSSRPPNGDEPLVALAFDFALLPEEIRKHRAELLSSSIGNGVGNTRQAIETLIRLELRSRRWFGVRSKAINEMFTRYPADGILWWMNKAYSSATRSRAGYLIDMLKRTRGEYPGRQGAA